MWDKLEKNNKGWLNGIISLPKPLSSSSQRVGRPKTKFYDSSERAKRRKTETLRRDNDLEELTFATQVKLGNEGKRDASVVLKEITSTPKRATAYKKSFSASKSKEKVQLTPQQALSMFIEADLSKRPYEIIRSYNPSMYPCYSKIQEVKKECYPDKESITVTETLADIKLQNLMDHTVSRLLTDLYEVVKTLGEEERNALELICKWGCDGEQQAQFKQKFVCDSDTDANVFQSSLVPLRLICSLNGKILWQNPTPSSPRYCRPIRLRFIKETADVTREEIKDASKNLNKTKVQIKENIACEVSHTMMLTMVDGKVCNSVTSTSSTMRCYICGLTSKDFNCIQKKGDS
ncbi:uncharacterized protein LOC126745321 [Anthonomus grandis grandis]|uniref:uncharacterized protein LOC126745321 n=1 Tax=Anthonomus grandis grandis TaxID=2921223 RepID=UPI0021656A55|nr:uncharacterized protein LOC126745321 [Anthonomus grandis grandis]